VLRNSTEHYEVIGQARYIISNNPMPPWFHKRPDQTYLQVWHGTPLKRIGFDIEQPKFTDAAGYLKRFSADVAQWDFLVSPNPFSTPILQRAFRYDGEVLEYGYPRNDVLSSPDTARMAAEVRARLGIPAGKRVVLYAPTWRDDQAKTGGYGLDMRLDLEQVQRALGPDHILLVRGHINVREAVRSGAADCMLDVSRYPDIAELYLASDALITDYSSVMFDFAVTGKPMLFFTYDLEHYRDEVRGFYFDFETQAPGPLLRTSDEVIAALRSLDQVTKEHASAYAAFAERFCPLDDGQASARIIDRIIT
jgi:CDP-glycerol glycerophosphotransferase